MNEKKKSQIRIKEPFKIKVLRLLVKPVAFFNWKYRIKSKYKVDKDEHIIVLSNHQTDLDPILIRLSFNRFLYTVATDNIFSKKKTSKFLSSLGAIPKRKGLADMQITMKMINIANQGGNLLLFPEGNRCYAEFLFYIAENMGRFLKQLKATIVLFNLHGGFGTHPRFGKKEKRRGKFYGEIKKVLKYDDYKDLSNEELTQIVKDNLKVYDSESGDLYKSRARAEYLERMLFVCPKCGKHSCLVSEGHKIHCTECGAEAEYGEDLHLHGDFPFTKLVDWYDYQRTWVKEYPVKHDEKIFEDPDVTLSLVNPFREKKDISSGNMFLNDHSLVVGDYSLEIKDIEIASPVSGRNLCFTIGEDNYQIRGLERFNALKYVLMFNHLETKMKQQQVDKYFALEGELEK